MSHIFISYIEQDFLFAQHLKRLLQTEGFTVWMDETGDEVNEDRWLTIEASIYASAAFLLIMSSQAQQSVRVQRELQAAHHFDKPILPIFLSGHPRAQVADLEYFDMTTGVGSALPVRLKSCLVSVVPIRISSLISPVLRGEQGREPATADTTSGKRGQFRNRSSTMAGIRVLLVVVIVAVFLTLIDFSGDSSRMDAELPSSTPPLRQASEEALSGTEIQHTVQVVTQAAYTEAALTAVAIATQGTPTPTIDFRGTVDARFTATQMAGNAQRAQAALIMSATAAVQTASETPTRALIHTPADTLTASLPPATIMNRPSAVVRTLAVTLMPTPTSSTPTSLPTATLWPVDAATLPALTTQTLVQLVTPAETATPTSEAVVPNGWNAGTILFILETTGVSQYAGQEPNRPEQFQPGEEVTIGLGTVAPGRFREWYVVPATQERWWFIDYLGGGWLPEAVLGDAPP